MAGSDDIVYEVVDDDPVGEQAAEQDLAPPPPGLEQPAGAEDITPPGFPGVGRAPALVQPDQPAGAGCPARGNTSGHQQVLRMRTPGERLSFQKSVFRMEPQLRGIKKQSI